MRTRGLVIFDAFNTLVTSRRGSKRTFLAGLAQSGIRASTAMLADLQAASEGLDHSRWSGSRAVYCGWAAETLDTLAQVGVGLAINTGPVPGTGLFGQLAPRVVPALEQWHQAPMVALPGAADCLARLKRAGFAIALCSNWGWDLAADLAGTGLAGYIDVFVTSAETGYRKPHTRIYRATLELAGFKAKDAVFVGDSLRTDALGPQYAGIRSVLVTRAKEQVHREQVASLSDAARLILHGATPLYLPCVEWIPARCGGLFQFNLPGQRLGPAERSILAGPGGPRSRSHVVLPGYPAGRERVNSQQSLLTSRHQGGGRDAL